MAAGLLSIRIFLERGGPVLVVIAAAALLLWTLLLDRWIYLATGAARDTETRAALWRARREHGSWTARQLRRLWLGELSLRLRRGAPMIRALLAVCPLLGLLGTVLGMIEVFDGIVASGSGNLRSLAGGISQATLSTLAGMVVALSGLLVHARLERLAQRRRLAAAEALAEEG